TASQVFLEGKNIKLLALYKKILLRLVALFIPVFTIAFFIAPWIVDLIFPEKWQGVGEIVQVLVFIKFFQVLNTPFSKTFLILNQLEIQFAIFAFAILLRFFSMWYFRDNAMDMLWAFSISGAVHYAINNACIFYLIKTKSTS
ncbi:MAG: hypothetical protein AB8F95_06375, partial [Bacteroidia bacterium]